ncbi:MAG: aminopeptidase [Candidatus Cyclobacteriaceae bacterium M2_1C_046]
MIRKIFLITGLILAILIIVNYGLIAYGIEQGIGQLQIVWGAKNIKEVINDPDVPDSIKYKLSLVEEVVDFGVREIALEDKGNYQKFYDQKGEASLFVVTAAEPFALKPYTWDFPVVGSMPYKGYFDSQDAEAEKTRLLDLGYDALIRTPGGWSTLGWFNDPVLSGMLSKNEGDLANVILHELTHSTIFLKDSITYNENLATFIGDVATEQFLINKFGAGSDELRIYKEGKEDFNLFVSHILRGADKLDVLYNKTSGYPVEDRAEFKEKLIVKIIDNLDTVDFYNPEQFKWESEFLPNNAYFMSFLRYRAKQDLLQEQFTKEFNNDLKAYVEFLSEKHN